MALKSLPAASPIMPAPSAAALPIALPARAFTLDGVRHELSRNEPNATLHGGKEGFDKRDWVPAHIEQGVRYTLFSPDGDQGFPGGIIATATYTLGRRSSGA